jgi:hypothetical protein
METPSLCLRRARDTYAIPCTAVKRGYYHTRRSLISWCSAPREPVNHLLFETAQSQMLEVLALEFS